MGNRLTLNLEVETVQEYPVGESGGGRVGPKIVAYHSALRVAAYLLQVIDDDGRQRLRRSCKHVGDTVQYADLCRRDHFRRQGAVARFSDKASQRLGCSCPTITWLHDGLASFERSMARTVSRFSAF